MRSRSPAVGGIIGRLTMPETVCHFLAEARILAIAESGERAHEHRVAEMPQLVDRRADVAEHLLRLRRRAAPPARPARRSCSCTDVSC